MSSRMSSIIMQNYYKFIVPAFQLRCNFLSSSAIAVQQKHNSNESIRVSKHLKPLVKLSVNEILSEIVPQYITAPESVTFLKAFRIHTLFNQISPETFVNDPRFTSLCDVFQKNCKSLNYSLLISGLRSLLEVGLPSNSPCVVSAGKQILANCSMFNASDLIQSLHFQKNYLESDLQKQIKESLELELVNKISEVSSPAEVLLLCNIYSSLNENNRKSIELKICELVPTLNIHEMCKVIVSLAQNSSRNIPILNAIAFHLRQKDEYPDMKEIVDMLYAFKKLNYIEMRLFPFLMRRAAHEIPNISQPAIISGVLVTCGHLKWRNPELLDACADWMKNHLDMCRDKELIAFILTSATLYHNSVKTKEVLELITPAIATKKFDSPNILLDVAWSLAILNYIPKALLLNVLSADVYESLLDDSDSHVQTTNKLKLMNLKGFLTMKFPEHVFSCNLYLEPIKLMDSSDVTNSRRHIIKVLSNFVPNEKFLSTNQTNDMGIFIDAEFIMDKNKKPLSLVEYGMVATTSKSSKPLPLGAQRIALLVMFHKDYILNTYNLSGVNNLATKLLTHQGFTVVHISFDEFIRNQTELQKVKYLMQKITVAMDNVKKSN